MDHCQFSLIALSSLHHVHWTMSILEGSRMGELQRWGTDKGHRFDPCDGRATGHAQDYNTLMSAQVNITL